MKKLRERLRSWVSPKTKILCAVSGGPDSVALAHLLKSLSYTPVLGHVDHQMRKTSARDAAFVQALAKKWNLPYEGKRVHVTSFASGRGLGLEEAARELRYKALLDIAGKTGCSVIVTGHTEDDQAETVVMNFLRGAGPTGLAGIPPVRRLSPTVRLLRPLLDWSRADVLRYVKAHHLPYRQDPSNRSARFTRNRIRNRLLPLLEKESPGLKKRLAQMAEIFREEQALWGQEMKSEFNKTVRQNNKKIAIDLPRLLGYHKALGRRILRHLLTGISFQDTERVFQFAHSSNGKHPVQLAGGLRVDRKGQELIISRGHLHE